MIPLDLPCEFRDHLASMGQQFNKVIKRRRRKAYLKRKKVAAKKKV
jgi:hypothetical protein